MSIRSDVMALARQYKAGTILFRGSIRALSNALHPHEQPQFVLACTITPSLIHTFDDDDERSGVIAITNQRIVHSDGEGITSLGFDEVHSMRLDTTDDYVVLFGSQTHNWHAMFLGATGGHSEYAAMFLRLLQQVATGAPPVSAMAPAGAQQVRVTCQSCAAHELLSPGQSSVCLYCNGVLQAPALEQPSAPVVAQPVAQEESSLGGGFLGGLLGGTLGEIIEAVVDEFI
ncbi:MAG: hypothetical protein FWE40_06760 [Oscillospiraceae bacterium]|nr:hypothetical protein [Oscillospiraceae bacterium]